MLSEFLYKNTETSVTNTLVKKNFSYFSSYIEDGEMVSAWQNFTILDFVLVLEAHVLCVLYIAQSEAEGRDEQEGRAGGSHASLCEEM